MMSARVIAVLRTPNGYVAYTIERAGPAPNVIHRTQFDVAFVQGAVATPAGRPAGAAELRMNAAASESERMGFIQH